MRTCIIATAQREARTTVYELCRISRVRRRMHRQIFLKSREGMTWPPASILAD